MALQSCYECNKTISSKAIICPQCGAPQNPFLGLVDKAKEVTVSSLVDKAKELFRFLRKYFIEFVKACRYKLIERKMDPLIGHAFYYGDHEQMKYQASNREGGFGHYCNREHWIDNLFEDEDYDEALAEACDVDKDGNTQYPWEDCDDKLIDIIKRGSRGLVWAIRCYYVSLDADLPISVMSWVEILYELVKQAGDLSKEKIKLYYFDHFLEFEYQYKDRIRKFNPNLTERRIDDLYILNVRDYESMNLPPLMDKAHLFDAPSKSFMEDFKKKWETLRDIKMEEKKKLRKSHPFLIEREIDDLYNIENKIHIDVDVFYPPPINLFTDNSHHISPILQKMLDESKK